jgi:hypothetical protein
LIRFYFFRFQPHPVVSFFRVHPVLSAHENTARRMSSLLPTRQHHLRIGGLNLFSGLWWEGGLKGRSECHESR